MHYCTVTLPVHLFLTMKSPEQAQISILKLPSMSRPNCGIISKILQVMVEVNDIFIELHGIIIQRKI